MTEKTKPVLCDEVCKEYAVYSELTPEDAFNSTIEWAQANPDYDGLELPTIKSTVRGRLMSRQIYRKLPESATKKPAKKRTTPSKADLTALCWPVGDDLPKQPGTFQNMSKLDICLVGLEFPDLPSDNYPELEKYRDILQAEKADKE